MLHIWYESCCCLIFFFFTKRRWLLTSKWVTIMSNIIVKILFLSAKLSTFVFSSVSKNINQSFRNSFGSFFVWYLCLTFLNGSQWLLGRLLSSIYHVHLSQASTTFIILYWVHNFFHIFLYVHWIIILHIRM